MRALVLCCLVFVIQGCKNLPVDQAVQVGQALLFNRQDDRWA